MESLIKLACKPDRLQWNGKLNQFFDLKKLDKEVLLRIENVASRLSMFDNSTLHLVCDCSQLTPDELSSILSVNTDEKILRLLQNLLLHSTPSLSLEELKSIPFSQFSEKLLQKCLGLMLTLKNVSTEFVCVLIDQMCSVNYGTIHVTGEYGGLFNINPLIHCCSTGRTELAKLLIDRYRADIEHLSSNDTTAIMYCAQDGYVELTEYLYEKGARLETKTRNIDSFAHPTIKPLINKWRKEIQDKNEKEIRFKKENENSELEKMKSDFEKMKCDFEIMKLDYEKIKSEKDLMKQNCESILNLIQNPK